MNGRMEGPAAPAPPITAIAMRSRPSRPPTPFAAALVQARVQRRLTRRELARQLGVSHITVRRWEAGTSMPSVRNYAALVSIVGAHVAHDAFARFEEVSRRIANALAEITQPAPPGDDRALFRPIRSRWRGGTPPRSERR